MKAKRRKTKRWYTIAKARNIQVEQCRSCAYPNHGFICWGSDGRCMKTIMEAINARKESKSEAAVSCGN